MSFEKKCWQKKCRPRKHSLADFGYFYTIPVEKTRRKTENTADSVQLQLKLPSGTELGNYTK